MIGNAKLKRTLVTATAVALAAAGPLAACSSDDEATDDTTTTAAADTGAESTVTIEDVWARPGTAGGNSAVYLTLIGGDTDDALVGVTVSADVVGTAEVHETVADDGGADMGDSNMGDSNMGDSNMGDSNMGDSNMGDAGNGGGMMTMREVDSIAIPAGGTVALEPGGYHIMLLGLTEDLVVGDTIEVTLDFESGNTETVTAEVKEP